jgi:hypothetical protein
MGGNWAPRERWTLDAWDKVLDWEQVPPKDAVTFLESQGIKGDMGNLTGAVLRSVGFMKLYESGRVDGSSVGGGAGAVPESHAFFGSVDFLKDLMEILKGRVEILERKSCTQTSSGCMQIFVKSMCSLGTMNVEIQPWSTVSALKEKLWDQQGLRPFIFPSLDTAVEAEPAL